MPDGRLARSHRACKIGVGKALKQDGNFALAKTRLSELPGNRLPLSEMDKLAFNKNAEAQRKAYAFISPTHAIRPTAH